MVSACPQFVVRVRRGTGRCSWVVPWIIWKAGNPKEAQQLNLSSSDAFVSIYAAKVTLLALEK